MLWYTCSSMSEEEEALRVLPPSKFPKLEHIWGVLTLERVTGMSGIKDPLFMLSQPLHKTPFSSKRLHFDQNSQKFEILLSKCPNCKFSVLSLRIGIKNLVIINLIWTKHQFCKQHCCQKISSASPQISRLSIPWSPFSALRAAHPYQNESWVPTPGSILASFLHFFLTISVTQNPQI